MEDLIGARIPQQEGPNKNSKPDQVAQITLEKSYLVALVLRQIHEWNAVELEWELEGKEGLVDR